MAGDAEAWVKPAPFEYVAVDSWEAAVEALTDDAQVLAGGQSLVPLLNRREVRPARLVDINGIPGLIRRTDGVLRIDATVRQAALERSVVAEHWPLLRQALRFVGHPATRSRGTVGGSVAHADPRAELVCALTALDARYVTTLRTVAGSPALTPRELLVSIELPPLPPGAKTAFAEHARTRGDFADAAAAVVLAPDHAAIAIFAAGQVADGAPSGARRTPAAERALKS
ncbi:FAD binding domain-containing protein, partial [Solirubrobacter taibaiensis]|nr:FAD binding domain-containing protein [Solirubrobacter taibaiensis]